MDMTHLAERMDLSQLTRKLDLDSLRLFSVVCRE